MTEGSCHPNDKIKFQCENLYLAIASSVSREKDENRNVNRNLVVGLSEPKKKTMTGLFKV